MKCTRSRPTPSRAHILPAFLAAIALLFVSVQPAQAGSPEVSDQHDWNEYYNVSEQDVAEWEATESIELTPEVIEQARDELLLEGYGYSEQVTEAGWIWVFDLGDGFEMALPAPGTATDPGDIESLIGGGITSNGMYITFNNVDQRALASGAGAALGAAICLIPGIGQAACLVSTGIVAAGIVYVNAYGICPNERTLRLDAKFDGTVTGGRCV